MSNQPVYMQVDAMTKEELAAIEPRILVAMFNQMVD